MKSLPAFLTIGLAGLHAAGKPNFLVILTDDLGFKKYCDYLSGSTNYHSGDKIYRLNREKRIVSNRVFYGTPTSIRD